MIFKKIKEKFGDEKKRNRLIVQAVLVVFSVGVALTMIITSTGGTKKMFSVNGAKGESEVRTDKKNNEIFVGDVDEKSYLARVEKEYFKTQGKVEEMEGKMNRLEKQLGDIRRSQGDASKVLGDIRTHLDKRSAENVRFMPPSDGGAGEQVPSRQSSLISDFFSLDSAGNPLLPNRLEMVKLGEVEKRFAVSPTVRLPVGSFCEGILLTSVYAPTDTQNPLPVLIMLTEAFYGPNKTRIPLKGAFAIGKAVGDLVSRRAIIQIVALSTVLPDGKVFENESNLGFVTDASGRLGIPGEIVYNSGKQLGLSFLAGFMSGAADAFADKESTTVVSSEGQTTKSITGDSLKYGQYSGLAKSASQMSDYYQRQLDKMVPAIVIKNAQKIVFVMQKGVDLEGLKVNDNSSVNYID